MKNRKTQQLKITAFSDWHGGGYDGVTLSVDNYKKQKVWQDSDVLMFAGDLTGKCAPHDSDTQKVQLDDFFDRLTYFLENGSTWKYIIGVFGNHDTAFDPNHKYGISPDTSLVKYFKRKKKEFNRKFKGQCEMLWDTEITRYTITVDEEEYSILASPFTEKIQSSDPWAFHWTNKEHSKVHEELEQPVDIVLSHDPVFGYGDKLAEGWRCGTKTFYATQYKPKVFISGHIHEAYGVTEGKGEFEGTMFFSVSYLNRRYEPVNSFVEIKFEK